VGATGRDDRGAQALGPPDGPEVEDVQLTVRGPGVVEGVVRESVGAVAHDMDVGQATGAECSGEAVRRRHDGVRTPLEDRDGRTGGADDWWAQQRGHPRGGRGGGDVPLVRDGHEVWPRVAHLGDQRDAERARDEGARAERRDRRCCGDDDVGALTAEAGPRGARAVEGRQDLVGEPGPDAVGMRPEGDAVDGLAV
jgi:hypothetical protein